MLIQALGLFISRCIAYILLISYLSQFTTLSDIRFMVSRMTCGKTMARSQPIGMWGGLIVVYFKYSEIILKSINYLRKSLMKAAVSLQIFESHACQMPYRSGIWLLWFLMIDYWII
jgi:hypothetical protein